ncbi:MAG TPA: amidohydrolase family protein [Candidatus Binataceae bacterium]|nr:amidohydrolase family protein [Candidatus Binataceae bacterium]
MSANSSKAALIRAGLNHPVIDADGHWVEFSPVVSESLRRIGGDRAAAGFSAVQGLINRILSFSDDERRERRAAQQAWWSFPTLKAIDGATALLPRLLYERLDELGLDYAVLYPTGALGIAFNPDTETRLATCRAFNTYIAEEFGPLSDRMTPAAVIPMDTPEEAVNELDFAIGKLGLKVVVMASLMRRPVAAIDRKAPEAARYACWYDLIGLDSIHDYDSVWAKCEQLGVAPTFHSGSRGFGLRTSPTNFVYNHIGHFAAAGEAVCKALFLGGVTRRFPKVKFAFLEGGVGWACNLYADLIGHWKKRSLDALAATNPANFNGKLLTELAARYGGSAMAEYLRKSEGALDPQAIMRENAPPQLDDFAACEIKRAEDIRDLFASNFYFGCEADDPINAWAFNRKFNPYGARLNALFGSDIGHFDVPDMGDVLPEAHELVEEGLITTEDFRDFVFGNAARFWTNGNPDFFKGTRVEKQVAEVVSKAGAN